MKRSTLILFITALGPASLGAIGIVFLKQAAENFRNLNQSTLLSGFHHALWSANLWVGIGMYAAAFIWMMLGLPYVKVSQFYPVAVGCNVLLTTLAAFWVLHEGIPQLRIIGIALILVGVICVSR